MLRQDIPQYRVCFNKTSIRKVLTDIASIMAHFLLVHTNSMAILLCRNLIHDESSPCRLHGQWPFTCGQRNGRNGLNYSPMHTKLQQACQHEFNPVQCGSGKCIDAHMAPHWTSRYDRNFTRQVVMPRSASNVPNVSFIGHQITDNIRCSPNAMKCMPESVKSIEFWPLFSHKVFSISKQEVCTITAHAQHTTE